MNDQHQRKSKKQVTLGCALRIKIKALNGCEIQPMRTYEKIRNKVEDIKERKGWVG
jgi:hypothetical protein